MIIETSRFGQLEVDPDRLITFEDGILGFPSQQEYALIQTGEGSGFYWLQSVSTHDLALVREVFPRMIIMDKGQIVADGLTAELLEDEALLEAHGLEKP